MKILICGLPGSGKSTLAQGLEKALDYSRGNAVWINADAVRTKYNDWDFSTQGRNRQASRMKYLADGVSSAGAYAIADFVCPTALTRAEFNADYTVWMHTILEGRYADTNAMFETFNDADYVVSKWLEDTPERLAEAIQRWEWIKEKNDSK